MKLQCFDILLIKRKSLVGRIIMWVTKSPYSHAALVIDSNHIIDTGAFRPLKISHMSWRLTEFDGYRFLFGLKEEEKEEIIKFYQKNLNSKYDFLEIFAVVFKKLFPLNNKEKFICSSIIHESFNSAGIKICNKDGVVTPADLSRSYVLTRIN